MKQFKELTIDEQLDLIKHVLEGNDVLYTQSPDFEASIIKGDKDTTFIFDKNYYYSKQPTKLETLYKEQEAIQEKIDAELKRLGKPVANDNVEVVQSPSEDKKTSENDSLERITYENWNSLGIKVGDNVVAKHLNGLTLEGELLALTKEYAIIQQVGHEQHLGLRS